MEAASMSPTRIQGAKRAATAAQNAKLPLDRRSASAANPQRRPQESVTSLEPSQHKEISRKIKLELTVAGRPQLIKPLQIVDASIGVKTLPGKGPFSRAPGASSSRPTSAAIRSCPLQQRGLQYISSRASDTHAALLQSEQLIHTPVFR